MKRTCAFCGEALTQGNAGTRAREHVFKKSWIEALGHGNTNLDFIRYRKENFLENVRRPAIKFLAGDICGDCNSGWMNEVDLRAEEYILGAAKGNLTPSEFNANGRFAIARWLLKTAATFMLSEPKERRHIPQSTLRKISRPDFLPKGFVAFFFQYQNDFKYLGAANMDAHLQLDSGISKRVTKSERLKFGIQYDRFLVGCAYVGCKNPVFIGLPRLHFPLYAPDENFYLDEDLWCAFNKSGKSSPFASNLVNHFLLGLMFWSEAPGVDHTGA